MAKTLSNSGITTNDTIRAGHVTQSVDALTGTDAYDITISGSLSVIGTTSGSFIGDGTGLTGVTGEWDGSHNGNASITGSLTVTSDISASTQIYGSRLNAAAYVLTPQINGVGGDIIFMNGLNITGNITSSGNISASGVINGQNFHGGVFGRIYPDSSQTSNNQFFTANANGLNSNASFNVTGNITASGDISSSGILYANTAYFPDRVITPLLRNHSSISIHSDSDNITLNGQITASGNISASGTITAVSMSGNGSGLTKLAAGSNGEIQFNNNGELFSNSAFIYKEGYGDFLVGDGYGNNTISASNISQRLTLGDANDGTDGYKIDILNNNIYDSKTPGIYLEGPTSFNSSITSSGLPTTEPTTTGSMWISGSSVAHPNSGYLMIFNP